MKYTVHFSTRFRKQIKLCQKRGLKMNLISEAIEILAAEGTLPQQYRPHRLTGNLKGVWECHIEPDWLMTWQQNDTELTLLFLQTGTHADLF